MINIVKTPLDELKKAFSAVESESWTFWSFNNTDSRYSIIGAIAWYSETMLRIRTSAEKYHKEDDITVEEYMENEIKHHCSPYEIYGPGGHHRYFVYANGNIKYSKHHGSSDWQKAANAGFDILG